jgi:aminocarboxymuconate-semialdehyde decarboxylase
MTGSAGRSSTTAPARILDAHTHVVPDGLLAGLAADRERFAHVRVEPAQVHGQTTYTVAFADAPPTRAVAAGLFDTEGRRQWRGAHGLDGQLLAGWVDVFGYQLPADEGAEWATRLTAEIKAVAEADSGCLSLGTIPLQDPARAEQALSALVDDNCPGVMISTRVGERELDDPEFTPFFEAADERHAVVYLHPGFGANPRYRDYGLVNGLGRLADSTVTVARLLAAGIPARYPNMRMVISHGGGAVPYVLGRLARNYAISDGPGIADPVESFGHLYFDSVVFDPAALEFLVGKTGPECVLLGSDYPFPIGDPDPTAIVAASGLSEGDKQRLLGNTAALLERPEPNG